MRLPRHPAQRRQVGHEPDVDPAVVGVGHRQVERVHLQVDGEDEAARVDALPLQAQGPEGVDGQALADQPAVGVGGGADDGVDLAATGEVLEGIEVHDRASGVVHRCSP
ncbi:hypothetical protein D9M69_660790 [compost metagenome]